MLWLGLTGGLGTGKSSVTAILRRQGVAVVDADSLARQAIAPGTAGYQQVIKDFGVGLVETNGEIDRAQLASLVFGAPPKLSQLEAIIHPYVKQQVEEFRRSSEKQGLAFAFYDVPLLFEKKLEKQFDAVVVVSCKLQTQLQRLKNRNSWSDEEIHKRLSVQLPLQTKEIAADYLIENNGSLSELEFKVQQMLDYFSGKTN